MKRIWLLICANKVSSALYICGVALAVTITMLLAIIWHVKLSPMYPEENRDRMAYITWLEQKETFNNGEDENTTQWAIGPVTLPIFTDSLDMVEAVAITTENEGALLHFTTPTHEVDAALKLVNPGFFRVYNYHFIAGQPITDKQWESKAAIAIIDDDFAKDNYGGINEAIGQPIEYNGVQCTISGVVAHSSYLMPESYGQVFIPYHLVNVRDSKAGYVGAYYAYYLLKNKGDFQALYDELHSRMNRFNSTLPENININLYEYPYTHQQYIMWSVFWEHDRSMMRIWLIAIVFLLVPAFNLSGLIIEGNQRRNQEHGIRKSFGASKWQLLWQVFVENFVLTAIGALIGLVLSWIVTWCCRDWLFTIFNTFVDFEADRFVYNVTLPMLFSWRVFALAVLAAFILNIVTSVLPTWLALRKPIVDQLRDVTTGRDDSSGFWRRYGHNALILAELVLIAVLSWSIIDSIAVLSYDKSLPLGYDYDRLVDVRFKQYPTTSPHYHPEDADSAAEVNAALSLMAQLKANPQVESACFVREYTRLEWRGNANNGFYGSDTTVRYNNIGINVINYPHNGHFFSTMGIKPINPAISPEELDRLPMHYDEVVITRDAALRGYGTIDVIGDTMWNSRTDHENYHIIRAVVENVRAKSFSRQKLNRFDPDFQNPTLYSNTPWLHSDPVIVLRLKPGAKPAEFIREYSKDFHDNLKAANFYCEGMYDFATKSARLQSQYGVTNTLREFGALAVFLASNIFLGIVGTFYLQTRRRSHEAGLRKSFGATSGQITRSLIIEGVVIAFIGWVIGCALFYLIWGHEGLVEGINTGYQPGDGSWVSNYWVHFSIVSAIVLAVMIIATVIAILIPARRISRITPVDALRDE
ncbi:MAG: FtsX-like permease family protein [Bacteroidales bacterium]|nr:FtsX-like permease family protein [Bacteroidales bacterium]